MDKRKLVAQVAKKSGYAKWEVNKITEALLGSIIETLEQGEEVCVNGFGKFEPKVSNSYSRIHPKTKQKIYVPEKLSVAYAISKKFTPVNGALEKVKAQKEKVL